MASTVEVFGDEFHQELEMKNSFMGPTIDTVSGQRAGGASNTNNVIQCAGRYD